MRCVRESSWRSCHLRRCAMVLPGAWRRQDFRPPRWFALGVLRKGNLVHVDDWLIPDLPVDLVRGGIRQVGEQEDEPAAGVELGLAGRRGHGAGVTMPPQLWWRVDRPDPDPVRGRPAGCGDRNRTAVVLPQVPGPRAGPERAIHEHRCVFRAPSLERFAEERVHPIDQDVAIAFRRDSRPAWNANGRHDSHEAIDPLCDGSTAREAVPPAPGSGERIGDVDWPNRSRHGDPGGIQVRRQAARPAAPAILFPRSPRPSAPAILFPPRPPLPPPRPLFFPGELTA